MTRPDELLVAVTDRLAGAPGTRRAFLTVAAGVGAGALLGCGATKMGAFPQARSGLGAYGGGPYGQDEVNVCYAPMRVLATEPEARRNGVDGVYVRKGPSFDAEITLQSSGAHARVFEGAHFARQSYHRAPGGGCRTPPLRPALDGWVFGYPADDVPTNKSGWIPVDAAGIRYAADSPSYRTPRRRWLCGPDRFDFDCRSEASKGSCRFRCGGGAVGRLRRVDRERTVRDRGSPLANNNEEYYLRWALGSTPLAWVGPGDELFEFAVRRGLSYGKFVVPWSFVEVRRSAFTPAGWRGWMLTSGLEPLGRGRRDN